MTTASDGGTDAERSGEAPEGQPSSSFSITRAPSPRVLRRLHVTRADDTPRAWVLVVITWVPLAVAILVHLALGGRPPPILRDLSVHARLLIVIPLVLSAERLLEQRCRSTVRQLYRGTLVEPAALDRIVERAVRLRDSRAVALGFVVVAVGGGQLLLWGVLGTTGVFAGVTQEELGTLTFARVWYATVSWPILQILGLRWLWHWGIWSYVLVRLARQPLATIATHPDHAAGLGCLAGPISAFASFAFALSTMIASAWATKILHGHATMQSFTAPFLALLVVLVVLGCGPLYLFTPELYRARYRGLEQYSYMALDQVRQFHRKWIESRPASEQLVSSPDVSALNDLCGSYASLVQVRLIPFGPRQIVIIAVATAIPMLPLAATAVPIAELAKRIGSAVLGGIPV